MNIAYIIHFTYISYGNNTDTGRRGGRGEGGGGGVRATAAGAGGGGVGP